MSKQIPPFAVKTIYLALLLYVFLPQPRKPLRPPMKGPSK